VHLSGSLGGVGSATTFDIYPSGQMCNAATHLLLYVFPHLRFSH
jgi:hypothetical protein